MMNNYQPPMYGNYGVYGNRGFNYPYQPNQLNQNMQQIPQESNYKPMPQVRCVDSMDVVKASEIPLDGSVSFFYLTDASAIVTKQLQMDGTSKTVVYKPVDEKNVDNVTAFITSGELEERLSKIKPIDYKEDIKKINRQLEDLTDEIDKINKGMKKRKDD